MTDTAIDPRTGRGPDAVVQAPVPLGPIVMGMPVTIGGEKRQDVPAEDLTIKLATGRLVQITQPRSAPPFAVGEPVLIQKERPNDLTGESRTRVVRDEDYSPAQVVR